MSQNRVRPPSSNPKSKTVQVRMDENTIQKLDRCADALQTSRSDIIRMGIDKVENAIKK